MKPILKDEMVGQGARVQLVLPEILRKTVLDTVLEAGLEALRGMLEGGVLLRRDAESFLRTFVIAVTVCAAIFVMCMSWFPSCPSGEPRPDSCVSAG
jgi:hypothetical protein